ncbi:hypothetical protein N7G274_003624 [Stereocaulon virgatum]|uniref:Uncharacterized protein n=1 Tax=Stereocaulon virgatum TaxID=373712 RepID=A0ABR4AC17_9LECA
MDDLHASSVNPIFLNRPPSSRSPPKYTSHPVVLIASNTILFRKLHDNMSPFPSISRVFQKNAQDGNSEEPSNIQEPSLIRPGSAITACSFPRHDAASSARVKKKHENAQQHKEAGQFVPGGHAYQKALAGISKNPRGDKSVEHWLYEWGTTWAEINQQDNRMSRPVLAVDSATSI